MGLEAAIAAIGHEAEYQVARDWRSGRVISRVPRRGYLSQRFGATHYTVHRADLQMVLSRALPVGVVRLGARCVGVQTDDTAACAQFADGSSVEADVVVGADGIHSKVRASLFGPEAPHFTGLSCWRGLVPLERLPAGLIGPDSTTWLGPRGHVVHYLVRRGELVNFVAHYATDAWTEESWTRECDNTGPSQAIDGFDDNYPVNEQRRPDGTVVLVEAHGKLVRGKLRQMRRIAGDDASFLKLHAPGPFKITMISPNGITHLWRAGVTDPAVYPSEDELRPEVEAIFKSEVQALVADGAAYIQFDEGFVRFINAATMDSLREQGVDLEHALEADIASENACYDLLPDGVLVACHLCRGNRVPWGGGTGGFEGLRFLPKGKVVALGLVSTKNPVLEQQDELLRRINEAARYCPIEQLALCPQCGFQSSSTRDGQFIPIEQQWWKLELIADTACKVRGTTGASRLP